MGLGIMSLLPIGIIMNKYGRKKGLLLSHFIGSVSLIICGFVTNFYSFLFFYTLSGMYVSTFAY